MIRGEEIVTPAEKEKGVAKKSIAIPISNNEYVFKEHLSDQLATKVDIKKSENGSGRIIVNFNSEVDLNRIMELLNK